MSEYTTGADTAWYSGTTYCDSTLHYCAAKGRFCTNASSYGECRLTVCCERDFANSNFTVRHTSPLPDNIFVTGLGVREVKA